MKKTLFFMLLLAFSCQQKTQIAWQEGTWTDLQDDGKLVMIDFWGTTCNPCHRLFNETFVDPDIVAFANTHFHAYKIDAWLPENTEVKKSFQIRGVPTLVFMTTQGQEIDRVVGFRPADQMLKEWQRIVDGVDPYPALKQGVESDPENAEKIVALAQKLNGMRPKGDAETMNAWSMLREVAPDTSQDYQLAVTQLAIHNMWQKNDPAGLEKKVNLTDSYDNQKMLLKALIQFFREQSDSVQEAAVQKQLAELYIAHQSEMDAKMFASFMNSYAWRMTQLELYLSDALKKIELGLSVLPADTESDMRAGQIDTKAEVLWKLGRSDEAISTIEESIALDPESKYFQNQKEKFFTQKELYQ